jgi:hypothetical protein
MYGAGMKYIRSWLSLVRYDVWVLLAKVSYSNNRSFFSVVGDRYLTVTHLVEQTSDRIIWIFERVRKYRDSCLSLFLTNSEVCESSLVS